MSEEVTDEQQLVSLHSTLTKGIDELFRLVFQSYSEILDEDSIYRMFSGVLAQTLGRHIAAFPESEREAIAAEVAILQDDMIAECLKGWTNSKPVDGEYDLANMKPMGNA